MKFVQQLLKISQLRLAEAERGYVRAKRAELDCQEQERRIEAELEKKKQRSRKLTAKLVAAVLGKVVTQDALSRVKRRVAELDEDVQAAGKRKLEAQAATALAKKATEEADEIFRCQSRKNEKFCDWEAGVRVESMAKELRREEALLEEVSTSKLRDESHTKVST
jgi:hypothetical protein